MQTIPSVVVSLKAIDLINKWDPIDTVDALELLTPQFTNKAVRQYSVSRLKQASNEVCLNYICERSFDLPLNIVTENTREGPKYLFGEVIGEVR